MRHDGGKPPRVDRGFKAQTEVCATVEQASACSKYSDNLLHRLEPVLKQSNEQAKACSTGLQAADLAGVVQTLVCALGKKNGLFQHRREPMLRVRP
jgi:hypothetical protein